MPDDSAENEARVPHVDGSVLAGSAPSSLSRLFLKLDCRDRITDDERKALVDRVGPLVHFRANADLVREGDRPEQSTLLVNGFTTRYRVLKQGQRQITAIHIPGDFVDLHSFPLKEMDHSVGALTDCDVVTMSHRALAEITEQYPHLTRLLWLSTLLDGAIHREWLVGIGRRSATQQLAHLVCEFFERLRIVELVDGMGFRFPVTQAQLADVLGMSAVHVNRTLQELRAQRFFTWEGPLINITDWDGLQRFAEFDPLYLHGRREAR